MMTVDIQSGVHEDLSGATTSHTSMKIVYCGLKNLGQHPGFIKRRALHIGVQEYSLHPKKLWNSLKTVLGRGSPRPVSTTSHSPDDFLNFFKNKTDNVARSTQETQDEPRTVNNKTASACFASFVHISSADMVKLIMASPNKQCDLDPAPTWIIKSSCMQLAPFIAYACNRSLQEGYLPPSQTSALVFPLLKKPSLDCTELGNYRPISHVTFISQIIKRVACNQITN